MNLDKIFIRSQFVQQIKADNEFILWHSLFGYPKIVSAGTVKLLNFFKQPKSIKVVLGKYEIDNWKELFGELISVRYLIPFGFDERKFLTQKITERFHKEKSGALIDYLELRVSEACNFRCSYCILSSNLNAVGATERLNKLMNFQTAKKAVDIYLDNLRHHEKKVGEISFGGGEPFLNWLIIKETIKYCHAIYGNDFKFQFSINTNGSLITPEILKFLQSYGVEIAPSLDGLKEGNDKVRYTRDGKGTFKTIIGVLDLLRNSGFPLKGVTATINEQNFHEMDERFIDLAAAYGLKVVQINVDVVNLVNISTAKIVEKLSRIRRYAKSLGIEVIGFWSRPAENLNNSSLEENVAFCGAARGNNLCVDPLGNIYSCGYMVESLGNIHRFEDFLIGGNYQRFIDSHNIGSVEMCKGCMIEGQCGGGCLITQEFSAARLENAEKIKKMCDFYKLSTKKLLLEQFENS